MPLSRPNGVPPSHTHSPEGHPGGAPPRQAWPGPGVCVQGACVSCATCVISGEQDGCGSTCHLLRLWRFHTMFKRACTAPHTARGRSQQSATRCQRTWRPAAWDCVALKFLTCEPGGVSRGAGWGAHSLMRAALHASSTRRRWRGATSRPTCCVRSMFKGFETRDYVPKRTAVLHGPPESRLRAVSRREPRNGGSQRPSTASVGVFRLFKIRLKQLWRGAGLRYELQAGGAFASACALETGASWSPPSHLFAISGACWPPLPPAATTQPGSFTGHHCLHPELFKGSAPRRTGALNFDASCSQGLACFAW